MVILRFWVQWRWLKASKMFEIHNRCLDIGRLYLWHILCMLVSEHFVIWRCLGRISDVGISWSTIPPVSPPSLAYTPPTQSLQHSTTHHILYTQCKLKPQWLHAVSPKSCVGPMYTHSTCVPKCVYTLKQPLCIFHIASLYILCFTSPEQPRHYFCLTF